MTLAAFSGHGFAGKQSKRYGFQQPAQVTWQRPSFQTPGSSARRI